MTISVPFQTIPMQTSRVPLRPAAAKISLPQSTHHLQPLHNISRIERKDKNEPVY